MELIASLGRFVMVTLLIGWIPALIAWWKGRRFWVWWLYGGALFIVALIHALLLERTANRSWSELSKIVLGVTLGGALGTFDGLTALISAPETAPQIAGIVIGSTFKGLLTGVLIGVFARSVKSLPLGILFGLSVGLLLSFAVAAMPSDDGKHYYWQIMLPGSILGMIVGYATQRFGERRQPIPAN